MGLISQCEFSISDPKRQCLGLFLKNKRHPQKIESESRCWFRAERMNGLKDAFGCFLLGHVVVEKIKP